MVRRHTHSSIKIISLIVIIFLSALMLPNISNAQCNKYENAKIEGVIIKEKESCKINAVLLQDTCSVYNKFTNSIINANTICDSMFLKSVIVNIDIYEIIEGFIVKNFSWLSKENYVKLYVGCVDNNNDTCVVVQFLKQKELRRNKLYLKQMNLIMGCNVSVKVAYFKIKNNSIQLLRASFPTKSGEVF